MDLSPSRDNLTEESILNEVNKLLSKLGAQTRLHYLKELDDHFFLSVYHALVGEPLEGALLDPTSIEDQVFNCQLLLDTLSQDILDFDLSHINALDIVSGNLITLQYLLEIFDGLVDLLAEEDTSGQTTEDDSENKATSGIDLDALSHSHEILSDVFDQEFGGHSMEGQSLQSHSSRVKGWGCQIPRSEYSEDLHQVGKPTKTNKADGEMSSDSLEQPDNLDRKFLPRDEIPRLVNEETSEFGSTESLIREVDLYTSNALRDIKGAHGRGPPTSRPDETLGSKKPPDDSTARRSNSPYDSGKSEDAAVPSVCLTDLQPSDTVFGDSSTDRGKINTVASGKRGEHRPISGPAAGPQNYHTHTHIHYHQTPSDFSGSSRSDSMEPTSKTKGLHLEDFEKDSPPAASREQSSKGVQFPSSSDSPHQDNKEIEKYRKLGTLADLDRRLEEIRTSVKNINDKQAEEQTLYQRFVRPPYPGHKESSSSDGEEGRSTLESSGNLSDTEIDYYPSPKLSAKRVTVAAPLAKGILRRPDIGSKPPLPGQRARVVDIAHPKSVRFRQTVESLRDQRLETLIKRLANEHKESLQDVQGIKTQYAREYSGLKKQQPRVKAMTKSVFDNEPPNKDKRKRSPPRPKTALSRVYHNRKPRGKHDSDAYRRKRSASASPVRKQTARGRLLLDEEDILPVMFDEFPHLDISPRTCRLLYQKQMHQIARLKRSCITGTSTKTLQQIKEAQQRQRALVEIMRNDLDHTQRIREQNLKKQHESQIKRKLREKRMAAARARRYYDEYQVQMRAKMQKRKYKEERIFKTLFEDALDIQRQRIHELRSFVKEKRNLTAKRQKDEIDSLENHYRDKFSMLAEELTKEKRDMVIREKHQKKVMHQLRSEMRGRMEQDIRDLQEQLVRDEDTYYFRELDAARLKRDFQLATYRTRP